MRWVFLVDTQQAASAAASASRRARLENEVPYDANVSRTWVERYVVTKDGDFHVDSPKAGRDGYTTPDIDQNGSGMYEIDQRSDDRQGFFRAQALQPVR